MRVVRVRSHSKLAPWDEPAGALPVLGEPLAERQERIARELGLTWGGDADGGEDPDTLYWDENLDLSRVTLRQFLGRRRSGQLALEERPARVGPMDVEPTTPEGFRIFGLRLGPDRTPVALPARGFGGTAQLPMGRSIPTFVTLQTATTIRHWMHLLRANLAAVVPQVVEQTLFTPWRPLWSAIRFGSKAWSSAVGRGCDIHPTARLEGCVLGRGVKVGAYSVLRGVILGDGAMVEDHTTSRLAYVGAEAHLANFAMFNLSILGRRSSVGHIGAQACIVGDESFVSTFGTLQDLALAGNVRVSHEGRIVDSGTPFLGSAIGHRVRIGSGITIAAGREVANDTVLTSDEVVRRPPAGGTWRVRGGQCFSG